MNENKTVMDALDAPQWTDFTCSPQVSDDFFNRLHLEHELEYHEKLKQIITSNDKYPGIQSVSTAVVSDFENLLDEVQITPIKVISPKNKHNKEDSIMGAKETTFEDLLLEAMSNLQVSAKKGRINQSITNLSTDVINKTPKIVNKRSAKSLSARKNLESSAALDFSNLRINKAEVDDQNDKDIIMKSVTPEKCNHVKHDNHDEKLAKKIPSRIVTSFQDRKITVSINKKTTDNQELCSGNDNSLEAKPIDKKSLRAEKNSNKDNIANGSEYVSSKIVTSFSSRKCGDTVKCNDAPSKKRPHLLTCIRRQSLMKHKRDERYISLAEAISKFQKGTPKRFRSISSKAPKPGPITSKQVTLKITRPISPALTSKTRLRTTNTLSHEDKENIKLEKVKNKAIKVNRVPAVPGLKNSELIPKIAKRSATNPETFRLMQSRKTGNLSKSESLSEMQSQQACHSLVSSIHDSINVRTEQTMQKKVHTIVSTEDANVAVKEVELGHFGIPTEPCDKPKKFTRTLPFSFEIRNKQFQERKERKLKQMQMEEMNKIKTEFHAKPAPSHPTKEIATVSKGKITPKQVPKELPTVKKTTPRPFSFEERNKLLLKKKEHLIKEALEKDKKAREFHATPLPEFRPVIVRGKSKENVKMEDKVLEKQEKNNKITTVTKTYFGKSNRIVKKNIDQENQVVNNQLVFQSDVENSKSNLEINKIKKTVLSEMNTDKRARDRKEFQEKIKRKEMEEEMLRRKEEEERLLREKTENVELRRMAEIKARPMPHFKPISVIKSNKPLTDPQSPAWVRKSKM